MKLTQTIYEGERRPFGYGFVTYDFMRDGIQVAPMPINWIIRFIDWAARKSQRPLTDEELTNHRRVKAEIGKQMMPVRIERYNAGYEAGFKSGWNTCVENAIAQLDKEPEKVWPGDPEDGLP